VTNINHVQFKRGENSLSTDKKIFLSKRVYRRDIGFDILVMSNNPEKKSRKQKSREKMSKLKNLKRKICKKII